MPWKWVFWGKTLILKTHQELQHLWILTLKLPICKEGACGRLEGEERIQHPLRARWGAGSVILTASPESLLAEHMIPAATSGPHRALSISSEVLRFYFCFKLTLTTQWEMHERGGGQETPLSERERECVCVVCACVRVLNNFMDICHAQLTLHCCILSCMPRLGRQW